MTKLCVKEPFQESTCPDIDNPHSNTKIDTNRTKLGFYHCRYFIRGIKMHLIDCCSSVNEVLSNEELLIEILLRLPVISILLFKSVSKRWLSLITSPYFTLRRNQNPNIDPPSGLFLEIQNYYIEYDFVPLDRANSSLLHITFPFGSDKSNVEILQSCNGLLLCFIRPYKLFVYNPSTNQFMLPGQLYSKLIKVIKGVKLAFDPTKSPHYKVVQARAYDDVDVVEPYVKIVSYSSETYSWSVYDERFPANCFLDFDRGVYWNGGINWLGCGGLHYKLDVNHLVLTTIEKPRTVDGKMYYDYKLFESRGCLILVCISCIDYEKCIDSRQVNVYEMMNECSEWSVKYVIDFGDIMTLFPKTWEMPRQLFNVRCIVVGEREEDSFLVLEVFGKVVLYKMVLKTLCKIYDFSLPVLQPFRFHCFPFIPSLAGV